MEGKSERRENESLLTPIYPFRWDITSRSQLGRLIGTPSDDRDAWLEWEEVTSNAYRWSSAYSYAWFLNELSLCAARVLALCDDSDPCFVGRSPESLFDYLSGLLFSTSWAERLSLLHFSMYGKTEDNITASYPGAIEEMRNYLSWLELSPQALARRKRAVTLVDIVATGRTLSSLVGLIFNWCHQIGFDWSAVQRKIRIVGLTERTETSPKTWRWQQHAEWTALLQKGTIKNVSVPVPLFHFLGAGQPKTTESHVPQRWGDSQVTGPIHNQQRLRALRIAAALFDDGRSNAQRLQFASELSRRPAMQHAWFRSLIGELKR